MTINPNHYWVEAWFKHGMLTIQAGALADARDWAKRVTRWGAHAWAICRQTKISPRVAVETATIGGLTYGDIIRRQVLNGRISPRVAGLSSHCFVLSHFIGKPKTYVD